ncbi:unnamed protein product [Lampetra fluviatilis]
MDRVNPASGGNACDRIVPAATKRSLAKSGERSVSPAASFARKTRRAGGGCGKCGRSRRPARLSAARINAGTVRRFPVLLRARPLRLISVGQCRCLDQYSASWPDTVLAGKKHLHHPLHPLHPLHSLHMLHTLHILDPIRMLMVMSTSWKLRSHLPPPPPRGSRHRRWHATSTCPHGRLNERVTGEVLVARSAPGLDTRGLGAGT